MSNFLITVQNIDWIPKVRDSLWNSKGRFWKHHVIRTCSATTDHMFPASYPATTFVQYTSEKRDLWEGDFVFKVSTSHCYAFNLSVTSRHLFIVGLNYENFDVFVEVRYSLINIGLEFLWNKLRAKWEFGSMGQSELLGLCLTPR